MDSMQTGEFDGWRENDQIQGALPTGSRTQRPERPASFNAKSFELPFHARGPAFYEWRDRVAAAGNENLEGMSEPTILAIMAQKDIFEERVHQLQKDLSKHQKRFEQADTEVKAWELAYTQQGKQLEEAKERIRLATRNTGGINESRHAPGNNAGTPIFVTQERKKHFTIKTSSLPSFSGERDAEKVITFLSALERAFVLRAEETDTLGSVRSWGDYAIQCLKGKAAEWAHLTWFVGEVVDWEDFKNKLSRQYIPADYTTKLRAQFANLTIDGKQPLAQFNEQFKGIQLRLRITTKQPGSDEDDDSVLESYLTKLENAASKEKGTGPISAVYAGYTQYDATWPEGSSKPKLYNVMEFCARLDDIHNRKSFLTPPITTTEQPKTTSQGGDAMDIYAADAGRSYAGRSGGSRGTGRGNRFGWRGYGRGRGSDRGGDKDKGDKSDDRSAKEKADWVKTQKCYHCDGTGHLKKDCTGYKKMLEILNRKDIRITEIEDEEERGHEAEN